MERLLIVLVSISFVFGCIHVETQKKLSSEKFIQIEAILDEANELMENGDLDGALKKTGAALKISASYKETRDMRAEIKRRMKLRDYEKNKETPKNEKSTRYSFVDVGVAGMLFSNPKSVTKILGENARGGEKKDNATGYYWVERYNIEEDEILRIYFSGTTRSNDVVEFEIRYVGMPIKRESIKIPRFVTSNGITLSITKETLFKILGEPTKRLRSGKVEVYEYTTDMDPDTYKVYYGRYTFDENNRLIRIRFGYETSI